MATRGVRATTLQKKCNTWARRLRLSDWDITCKYPTKAEMEKENADDNGKPKFDEDTIGYLIECAVPEKIALVAIRRKYYDHDGFGVSWNLDTLILHELIHIIEKIGKVTAGLPKTIKKRKDVKEFEEFNCDCFAAVIYYMYYDKI